MRSDIRLMFSCAYESCLCKTVELYLILRTSVLKAKQSYRQSWKGSQNAMYFLSVTLNASGYLVKYTLYIQKQSVPSSKHKGATIDYKMGVL